MRPTPEGRDLARPPTTSAGGFTFVSPCRVCRVPSTRRPATLLGPCFKTGRTRRPRSRPTDLRGPRRERADASRPGNARLDGLPSSPRPGPRGPPPRKNRTDAITAEERVLVRSRGPSSEAGVRRGGRREANPANPPCCGPAVTFDARDGRSPGRAPNGGSAPEPGTRTAAGPRGPVSPRGRTRRRARPDRRLNPPDAPCSMRLSSVYFSAVSRNLNPLFKVLFNVPSRYLSTIGLVLGI